MDRIYLDNNATTRVAPEAIEAMLTDLEGEAWNPSSVHAFGRDARNAFTKAHRSIARVLGARPSEVIFTSGGTESANLVLGGIEPGHVITSTVEHPCVYNRLQGWKKVTFLEPGVHGAVQPEQVREALRPDTRLIALMAVNNETGVRTDIAVIGAIAEEAGIPFFVDGVALLGKEPFEIPYGVSAMGFSGHKLHGPKGIGLLFVRSSFKLTPLILGGHQQYERRGGTENLPGILGLAAAMELPLATLEIERLRNRLEEGLAASVGAQINGEGARVCNTSNLYFPGMQGDALLMNLDLAGIAVSHGSACSSGSLEPSRILLSMGYERSRAAASLRFSLSRYTTEAEIDRTIAVITELCAQQPSVRPATSPQSL